MSCYPSGGLSRATAFYRRLCQTVTRWRRVVHAGHGHPGRLSVRLGVLLLSSFIATPALASGGIGGGGFSGTSGQPRPPREVDEAYEYGKLIYTGRAEGTEKVKYCVLADGQPKKLKRSTLKPFRNGKSAELANAIYDCDNTEQLALAKLDRKQVPFVLYYLNKRYKLNLSS